MSGYFYRQTDPKNWTVARYRTDGLLDFDSDHVTQADAANRVDFLNSGVRELKNDMLQVVCAILSNPSICESQINDTEAREITLAAARVVRVVRQQVSGG